jgi:hypothetical protein
MPTKDPANTNLYKKYNVMLNHLTALESRGNSTIFKVKFQNFISLWEGTPLSHTLLNSGFNRYLDIYKTVYIHMYKKNTLPLIKWARKDIKYNFCHMSKMLAQSSNMRNFSLLHSFYFVFVKIVHPCVSPQKTLFCNRPWYRISLLTLTTDDIFSLRYLLIYAIVPQFTTLSVYLSKYLMAFLNWRSVRKI